MTTQTDVLGFNTEQLHEFSSFAEQNPDEVLLTASATNYWEGNGGQSLAKMGPWKLAGQSIEKRSRDYSLQLGAWKEVEEAIGVKAAADRLEAVELVLAALNSCVTYTICANCAMEGIRFEDLAVRSTCHIDPRVLLQALPLEQAPYVISSIQLNIEVGGDEVDEATRDKIRQMSMRSPVRSMIGFAHNIQTNIN